MAASRYDKGFVTYTHRDVKISSSVGHPFHDGLHQYSDQVLTGDVGTVPVGFEHRPDLISNVFYGTPENWWLLMMANNVVDPFEGFNVGDTIIIPKLWIDMYTLQML